MPPVFDYEIPLLHPFAVHFPVALFVAAAIAAVVWLIRGRSFWRRVVLFVGGLATAGTLAAYLSGDEAAAQAEGVPIADLLVDDHAAAAQVLLWAALATLAALGGVSFWLTRRTTLERDPPDPRWVRVVFTLLFLALALLVLYTARLGGTMVWGVPA